MQANTGRSVNSLKKEDYEKLEMENIQLKIKLDTLEKSYEYINKEYEIVNKKYSKLIYVEGDPDLYEENNMDEDDDKIYEYKERIEMIEKDYYLLKEEYENYKKDIAAKVTSKASQDSDDQVSKSNEEIIKLREQIDFLEKNYKVINKKYSSLKEEHKYICEKLDSRPEEKRVINLFDEKEGAIDEKEYKKLENKLDSVIGSLEKIYDDM